VRADLIVLGMNETKSAPVIGNCKAQHIFMPVSPMQRSDGAGPAHGIAARQGGELTHDAFLLLGVSEHNEPAIRRVIEQEMNKRETLF
jgi:hypothetical protein